MSYEGLGVTAQLHPLSVCFTIPAGVISTSPFFRMSYPCPFTASHVNTDTSSKHSANPLFASTVTNSAQGLTDDL